VSRTARSLVAAVALLLVAAAPAAATHSQPALDRTVLKGTYSPTGFYKAGDPIPSPLDLPKADANGLFNPSGKWNALDNNVFETLNFPTRQGDDASNADPLGSGDPRHGFCPPSASEPNFNPYGKCANHQLEFIDHYEKQMKSVLKDFGVVVHRYPFEGTASSEVRPVCCGLSAPGGKSYNVSAIVPGADHPEQMVIVGAHFDTTDTGPAPTWDSSEGHAQSIRMAAIMAEYWKKTGTRPSATMIFMPWDQEETGTNGSKNWLATRVLEDEATKRVRAYFNTDPCTAAYPAYYHGDPTNRIPLVLQLSDPAEDESPDRAKAFNEKAGKVIDDYFTDIDDTIAAVDGPHPVYTDADRGEIVVALGGLLAFGSDYSNFDALGIPVFNMFADILGPHADGSPGASSEGPTFLHTPRDNLQTINTLTGPDQTGATFSDGQVKSQEFCSQIHSRYMLEAEMAGHQTANGDPLAFFDVFPRQNGLEKGKLATFDAAGSHQLSSTSLRTYVDDSRLQYKWEFGDKTGTAFGKLVKHAYKAEGTYPVRLTVTNRDTNQVDQMALRVMVGAGEGTDSDPAGQGTDNGSGPVAQQGSVVACQSGAGFSKVSVTAAGTSLKIDGTVTKAGPFTAELFQVAKGKKAAKAKKVATLQVNGSTTYDGKKTKKGTYFLRLTSRGNGSRPDIRDFPFERTARFFKARKAMALPDSCDTISVFRLDSPVFGGARKLGVTVALTKPGKVTVSVFRGKARKPVKRFSRNLRSANRAQRFSLKAGKRIKAGEYRVVLTVKGVKGSKTLSARRG